MNTSNAFQKIERTKGVFSEIIVISGDFPWKRIIEKRASKSDQHYICHGEHTLRLSPMQAFILDTIERNPAGVTTTDFEHAAQKDYKTSSLKVVLCTLRKAMSTKFGEDLLVGQAGNTGSKHGVEYASKTLTYRRR